MRQWFNGEQNVPEGVPRQKAKIEHEKELEEGAWYSPQRPKNRGAARAVGKTRGGKNGGELKAARRLLGRGRSEEVEAACRAFRGKQSNQS